MHHHHQQGPAAAGHLDRIYVGASGAVKGLYADGRVLLLSTSGRTFTLVGDDGGASRTTQLCEACLHRWRPLLAELLAFRNQHVDVPAWPRWLVAQLLHQRRQPPAFVAGYPITAVAWPASAQGAFEAGLVELLPGQAALVLHSVCRSAQLVLELSGLRFSVCYPLLLARDEPVGDASSSSSSGTYSYCQHTQVFSRSQCPRRWHAALAVAVAAADLAAQGFTPAAPQPQSQQQPLLLEDVTNTRAASACAAGRQRSSSSSWGGSPTQHIPAGGGDGGTCRQREWVPPGEPGSPSRAMYDVAEQQQWEQVEEQLQEHSLFLPTPSLSPHRPARRATAAGAQAGCGRCNGAAPLQQCVTQLPISPELLQALPQWARQQQQQDEADTAAGSSIASSVAQVLGARQQERPGDNGSSWWLQPSVLLPADELLLMVWSREATLIFLQEACEVEAWLHGDDSCMTTFQGGAFINHLRPAAAAAGDVGAGRHTQQGPSDGGHDGGATPHPAAWGGASRVYAAAHLPAELSVPAALQPDGPDGGGAAGSRVLLPLGRVAAEALKLRSTMVRVQQDLQQEQQQHLWQAGSSTGSAGLLPPLASWRSGDGTERPAGATQPQLSLQVVEEQEVPGLGCFSAYADGRVRVVFEDRTLLGLDGCRSTVRITLPDGSVHRVAARAPLGLERYVQPALEFASWAMHTPVQRAAALRTQALVASECRSSARMAAICEWAGSSPQRVALPSPPSRPGTAAQPSEERQRLRPAAAGTSTTSRQAAVEQCLAANALLLERLQAAT